MSAAVSSPNTLTTSLSSVHYPDTDIYSSSSVLESSHLKTKQTSICIRDW